MLRPEGLARGGFTPRQCEIIVMLAEGVLRGRPRQLPVEWGLGHVSTNVGARRNVMKSASVIPTSP
jgi:F420-0:gamma-glutamyl ligase